MATFPQHRAEANHMLVQCLIREGDAPLRTTMATSASILTIRSSVLLKLCISVLSLTKPLSLCSIGKDAIVVGPADRQEGQRRVANPGSSPPQVRRMDGRTGDHLAAHADEFVPHELGP